MPRRCDRDRAIGRIALAAAGEHAGLPRDAAMAGKAAQASPGRRIGPRALQQALEVRQHVPTDAAPGIECEACGRVDQLGRRDVAIAEMAEHPAVTAWHLGRGGSGNQQQPALAQRSKRWQGEMMHGDRVLFLDGEALVIDKPAGLPVDPPRDGSLSLDNHLESLRFGFHRVPTAVHRLDRDTSGCLLLARNPKAHARLQQAFERGEVEKTYLAVLDGVPAEERGTIELALAKISSAERGWRMVSDPAGKSASTGWQVLEVKDGRALVRFMPTTGRTHQIRVHAATGLGISVVGDPVYGRADRGGMLLHAARLIVPRGAKPAIEADAPIPARFRTAGFGQEALA